MARKQIVFQKVIGYNCKYVPFGFWDLETDLAFYDCITDINDLGIFGLSKTPTLFDWLLPKAIH